MKNFLFACFLFIFIHCFSFAQISITQSDMPNAGDTLRVSYSMDVLDPMITDSTCIQDGYVWNYSYLTPNSQWVRKFDSPTTFTFPFNIIFNPFNTSYGEAQYTPDSIPFIGIKPDDAYNFYKETSTRFKQVGGGFTINSLPLPFVYNPHDTIYRFPISCGNRDTSYAQFGLQIPGLGYYGQQIRRWNFSDGHGDLITPFGTFQTVRVRSMIAIRDTFADSSGTFGFAFNRPLEYEFKWLGKGGKIPYLQVNATDVGGNLVVTQIQYQDSMRGVLQIGIDELHDLEFMSRVYPNPASEIVFISYALNKTEDVTIELFDITCRRVFFIKRKRQHAGNHMEILNIGQLGLDRGAYLLKIGTVNKKESKKIILANEK